MIAQPLLHRQRTGLAIFIGWAAALLLGVACGPASAHKGSDAYFDIQQANTAAGTAATRELNVTLAVTIRDLDVLVPIDANADGRVTWGEIKAAMPQVLALFDDAVQLESGAAGPAQDGCRLQWKDAGLENRGDGVYIRAQAQARCAADASLRLRYSLLKEQDATHRLLVAGRLDGNDLLSTVSPVEGSVVLSVAGAAQAQAARTPAERASSSRWSALFDYFSVGLHHLLQGYDHLAFLLALVLPLQLTLWTRAPLAGSAAPATASASRKTWITLLRTVTAFTVGHSVTLILATFGFTEASPVWVEPAIALTIGFTALLNLRPVLWIRIDALALVFGMVHGFGFAGLLKEAAAPDGLLPWALAGFNLGIEAGQLIAVTGWVIVSQLVVSKPWYPQIVVRGGSVVLMLLAAWWFWQRVA